MSVEQNILITLLKLTRNGPTTDSLVGGVARIPSQTATDYLEDFLEKSLIRRNGKVIEVTCEQRLMIAVQAIKLGADFERVCKALKWKEFESITETAFRAFSYYVVKNFRFKTKKGKRWEIDVLAFKEPIIASVDCKHWKSSWTGGTIRAVVEAHVERTRSFFNALPDLRLGEKVITWRCTTAIPIIISLLPGLNKFYLNVPVVSVLQLQDFINEFPIHINSLAHFSQKVTERQKKITKY
ncbi:MAG: NERD domain-containing protein [Candidatus Bathyarchaeota archaeon]|nr:MAG: NERD domain-containing protein [Candidatus Bathyarchaeota archaeon]